MGPTPPFSPPLYNRVALDEPGLARSREGKRRLVAPADW